MPTRILVLGAMPPDANPDTHLAAGPWCFSGQEALFPDWERKFSFAPEPLADSSALPLAAKAAWTVASQAILRIASANTQLPVAYWQTLYAPWAISAASQLVERALRCSAMRSAWGKEPLIVPLAPEKLEMEFIDDNDFSMRGALGLAFNFWLFSRLLKLDWPENWQAQTVSIEFPPAPARHESLRGRLRALARDLLLKLPCPRLKGLSLRQALLFSGALMHDSLQDDQALSPEAFIDNEALARVPLPDNLGWYLSACLPLSLKKLRHKTVAQKKVSRARIGSVIAYEDARYRQKLARWRAQGQQLGFVQHGGNYGQARIVCNTEFVEYSQSFFISWGWRKHGAARGNFIPLPYPQLAIIANKWQGANSRDLVFVGAEMPAYAYRLDSRPTPLQYVAYRQAKADFFQALAPQIVKQCFYRPYFDLPGTLSDAAWLLPRFPGLKRLDGPLQPKLLTCRLLLLDHHGTVMLEAMAANTPLILYWKRQDWPLTDACEKLLDQLEKCGIWHPDPASAARKVAEVWDNPQRWWQSKQIQTMRSLYCEKQALVVNSGLNHLWLSTLKKL